MKNQKNSYIIDFYDKKECLRSVIIEAKNIQKAINIFLKENPQIKKEDIIDAERI